MSPAPHAYLDQKYDETTELGLTWAGAVEVRDAYEWDPAAVIESADVARRRGRAVDRDHRDARRRRLAGLPAPGRGRRGRLVRSGRDWEDFRDRLAAHGPLLRELGVNFHPLQADRLD